MYLVYVDDSSDNADYCVMGAAIIKDTDFNTIESWLAANIVRFVPEDLRDRFEFHASALFNGKDAFRDIPRPTALQLMERVAAIMADGNQIQHYFVYGAVNLRSLRGGYFSTAQPQDVAFRICLEGIHNFFQQPQFVSGEEMGLVICDDTNNTALKEIFSRRTEHGEARSIQMVETGAWRRVFMTTCTSVIRLIRLGCKSPIFAVRSS